MSNMNIKTWIEMFDGGAFDSNIAETQIAAGWYDWFCRTSSLRNKTYKMAPMIKRIAKSSKINTETMYVFFKNNCPMVGSLYDDFRICNIETDDVGYTIIPKSGHRSTNGKAELWGTENGFEESILTGTMRDVYAYFGV